jgi:hypothetical protein
VNVSAMETARARLGPPTPTAPPSPRASTPAAVPAAVAEPSSPPPPATEAPKEAPGLFAAPETTAPAYVAGAIGLTALTTAIVLHGMTVNANRNVSVGQEALARSGKDESACATPDASIVPTCASLDDARKQSSALSAPTLIAVGVGAGATLFALAWWMFATKENEPAKTGAHPSPARAVSVSAGARGASGFDAELRVRF